MSYAIDERDLDRQRLLAQVLNPISSRHLERLVPTRAGRWLDVGSGIGETTTLLSQLMSADSECVGLEQDPALIAVARDRDWAGRHVVFKQGDAVLLPFESGSFDFVFTRYLLVHLPRPLDAIREMLRVTKPGGTIFAHEPDLAFNCSYPPSPSHGRIAELWAALFPDAQIGRKLVHLFREAGAQSPKAHADILLETDAVHIRRIYRMTFEAIGAALVQSGRLRDGERQELLNDFLRVEADPSIVLISNPVVAVWATV